MTTRKRGRKQKEKEPPKESVEANPKEIKNFFVSRLGYFERRVYINAKDNYLPVEGNCSKNVEDFLSFLLETSGAVDEPAMRNAFNFYSTWFLANKSVPQTNMNLLLKTILNYPTLTPKMLKICSYMKSSDWIFLAIKHSLKTQPDVVRNSMKRDDPIWDYIVEEIRFDSNAKAHVKEDIYNRKETFLVECFVLFWPSKSTENVKIEDLAKSFMDFCVSTRSKTTVAFIPIIITAYKEFFDAKNYSEIESKDKLYELGKSDYLLQYLNDEGRYDIDVEMEIIEVIEATEE